uniref:Genetic suppressor element-like domain-containing protein n=1 Tax=Hucho hucho TaxID=62062 RepID=A0A4W5QGU7_9TELE
MLRERSPSPPAVLSKRTPPPPAPLSTHFTPEEMDRVPELEDKKRFLTMFSLSHVSVQQRRDNETVEELLQAIKQKSVTLDTIRHAPHPLCKTPPAQNSDPASALSSESDEPLSVSPSSPGGLLGQPKPPPSSDALRPKDPPPPLPYPEKTRGLPEGPPSKRSSSSSLLNSLRPPVQPKDAPPSLNGRTKPWESFTAEEFAQQFHESVLQSTQKALQKHKGGATVISAPSHLQDSSVHYNIPELQSAPSRPPPPHPHTHSHSIQHPHSHPHPQPNGQHCPPHPHREPPGVREEQSAPEDSEEDEEEEEEEVPVPRWQGIEAVFEAYQEYIEEQGVERQVLQSQCRRLENQHYNLSLTAEQLSHSMGELMSQRQKLAVEREKLQAELEHFRKCLTLPQPHWARGGHYKGYPPR